MFFLQIDYDDLLTRIEQIRQHFKESQRQIGESSDSGSATWHDNFAFEQAHREHDMWAKRLDELLRIKNKARLVEPDYLSGYVGLGHLVTFEDLDTQEVQTLRIGSFLVLVQPDSISYSAPLAKLLLGLKVGEIRAGQILDHIKRVKILMVETAPTHQREVS